MNQSPTKIEKHISALEKKIVKIFDNNACGHNIDHLRRTLNFACALQQKEGGDLEVIAIASFIHDVHRIMQSQEKRYVAPKESLPKIRELIADLELTQKQKDHICHCIEFHEQYNFGTDKVTVKDIETLILQDADNLDAIGAVGIIRCVQYNATNNVPMYLPNIPLYQNEYDETAIANDCSCVHHINNKLLRLGEHMNTKSAREMATEKTELMKAFVDMVVRDWT